MKEKIIVTRRRYGFLRTLLLVVCFGFEYCCILDVVNEMNTSQFVFSYAGYMIFILLFLGNVHNSGVYLRYETELSLVFRTIVIDFILGFFLSAVYNEEDLAKLWLSLVLLVIANIVTITIVYFIMNRVARKLHPKNIKRLYIDEHFDNSSTAEICNEVDKYDEIYIKKADYHKKTELLEYCFENGKLVYITMEPGDILIKSAGLAKDGDTPVYYNTNFGIGGVNAIIKRCFDVVASAIALVVLSPLMLIAAIAIKLEDGGEIVYRQRRCTKDMKEFTLYKFRSMTEDSEKNGAVLAQKDDERITRTGRILRATKFDETLQFVNIIKGDMSIVGPRPERPERIKKAVEQNPEFALRNKVKAGLTGYAQVHGRYDTDFKNKLNWDLLYIENFSLLLDVKIMVMTVIAILRGQVRE
ncbi:MAG: sugar transferase [Lachnospiraceae bacterium]